MIKSKWKRAAPPSRSGKSKDEGLLKAGKDLKLKEESIVVQTATSENASSPVSLIGRPKSLQLNNLLSNEVQELLKELKTTKQKNSLLSSTLSASKQKAALLQDNLARIKAKLKEEAKAKERANELAKALAKAKSKIETSDTTNGNLSSDQYSRISPSEMTKEEQNIKHAMNTRQEQEQQLEQLAAAREEVELKLYKTISQAEDEKEQLAAITAALDLAKQERNSLNAALCNVEEEIKLLQTLRSRTGFEVRDGGKPKNGFSIQSVSTTIGSPEKSIDFTNMTVSDLRQNYERLVAKTAAEKELLATTRDKFYCIKSDIANLKSMQRSSSLQIGRTRSMLCEDSYDGIYEMKTTFLSSDHHDTDEADFFIEGLADITVDAAPHSLSQPSFACTSDDAESSYHYPEVSNEVVHFSDAIKEKKAISIRDKKAKLMRSSSKSSVSSGSSDSVGDALTPQSKDSAFGSNCNLNEVINRVFIKPERDLATKKIQQAISNREKAERALMQAKANGSSEDISNALANMLQAEETEFSELQSATQTVQQELAAIKDARNVTDEAMLLAAAGMASFTRKTLASIELKCQPLQEEFENVKNLVDEEYAQLLELKEQMIQTFGPIAGDEEFVQNFLKSNTEKSEVEFESSSMDDDFAGSAESDEDLEAQSVTNENLDVGTIQARIAISSKSLLKHQRMAQRAWKVRVKKESEAMVIRINREKEEAMAEESERLRQEEELLADDAAERNDPIEEARLNTLTTFDVSSIKF